LDTHSLPRKQFPPHIFIVKYIEYLVYIIITYPNSFLHNQDIRKHIPWYATDNSA
jgi:hypothetical protein